MISSQYEHIEYVVRSIERRIRERPDFGVLDSQTVLALDVVMHALQYTHAKDGLLLWREALWRRTLSPQARSAIVEMMEYLMTAAANGEISAVTGICNCLQAVVDPHVFGTADA